MENIEQQVAEVNQDLAQLSSIAAITSPSG
jgi:hypothetical protein